MVIDGRAFGWDEFWQAYWRDRSERNRNALAERYLPLVRAAAQSIFARLPRCDFELDDLIQEGISGLFDAIERFDPTRETLFRTYCQPRIRGAMIDAIRRNDWVPRKERAKENAIIPSTSSLFRLLRLEKYRGQTRLEAIDPLEDERSSAPSRNLDRKEAVRRLMRGLSKVERLVLILYYFEELTMKEIGEALELSESRISQMHARLIERLRKKFSGGLH